MFFGYGLQKGEYACSLFLFARCRAFLDAWLVDCRREFFVYAEDTCKVQHRFVKVGDAFLFHTYINRRQTVPVVAEIYDFPHSAGIVQAGRSSLFVLPRPEFVLRSDNISSLWIVAENDV